MAVNILTEKAISCGEERKHANECGPAEAGLSRVVRTWEDRHLPVGGDLACNHDVGALLAAPRAEQALPLRLGQVEGGTHLFVLAKLPI